MAKKKPTPATDAPATDAPASTGPSTAMIALFANNPGVDIGKLERRNMPQMIKPGDVPMGGIVSGEIIKIVNSPVSTVKGKLLWLKHSSGTEFTFPCTGVIRNALAPGLEGKDVDAALQAEVGKLFFAKRTMDKQSQKYKKNMFMFDVFTQSQ